MVLPSLEQVTEQVAKLISILIGELSKQELHDELRTTHREYFRTSYLNPAIEMRLVGLTILGKPRSRNQNTTLLQKER